MGHTKRSVSKLHRSTFEYVVKHGDWRIQRGKRPSVILPPPFDIRNPEKAYQAAKKFFNPNRSSSRRRLRLNVMGQTPLEAMLGIPSPYQEPWPGARKVPHTCYQWY